MSEPEFLPDDRRAVGEGDRSILIIEDDARFAGTLMDLSRKKGYKCLAAGSARSGLQLAHEYKPNAIILDLGLPDINGLNVLDNLKHNLDTRHIPTHVISAREESAASLQKGAVGYLAKPASLKEIDEVFSKFENILDDGVRKLLLVEDDEGTCKAIERLLKTEDIFITEASNGKEAHQLIRSQTFDCVILDINLPDMTGFELLRKLDMDDSVPNPPPVVVYTGRELTRDEHRELYERAQSIVVKGANSSERLLDEVSLFLHSVESSLPASQREIIRMLHETDEEFVGRKILLVDDDLRNTFALSKVLCKHGMETILADNGQMALEKLESEPEIDLVLMDIMMPVMDGLEATRRIRRQSRFEDLPIIALTAKAMPEDRTKCIEAGVNDYLRKPVDINNLLSMLRIWLFECKQRTAIANETERN